ncbi:Hypothetical protein A7982_11249 [Minicystis rosea]|nr:Hypothetical protein A7982_11249 [Minicystis rosea]
MRAILSAYRSASLAGEVDMRRDWFLGFGAVSTLMVLVGIDVALAMITHKGQVASESLLRSLVRR